MKLNVKHIAIGFLTAVVLTGCGGGGSNNGGGTSTVDLSGKEWLILATDTSNNVTAFGATPSLQAPFPQVGQPVNLGSQALGEVHFANGKAFVIISSGLTGPSAQALPSGGVAVYNISTQQIENTVILESTLTGKQSRPVHVYLDPEGKHLWVNNDGPSGDTAADSVFRINVDPSDTANYLKVTEILVGNGHKKSAFSRPSANQPSALKLFFTSDLTERRINVIDDDPTHTATYGTVIKIVRNAGNVPHGMDYAPNSGRAFAGLTGGGIVAIDATRLDLNADGVIDNPDFDCGATLDCSGDPSVFKLSTGAAPNDTLFAGYVHVHTNEHGEDLVYTSGYSAGAAKGFLTAVNPGAGTTAPSVAAVIDLGDMSPSSFNLAGEKIYVPSSGTGAVKDKVKVVDANHDSGTFNTIIKEITVGAATGENRNGYASADGRLVAYPNTSTNTVSVIDIQTDTVVDTVTTPGPARTVGIVHLPIDAEDNH